MKVKEYKVKTKCDYEDWKADSKRAVFLQKQKQIKLLSNSNARLCQTCVISFVKSVFSLMIHSKTELIHFRVIGNNLSSGAQWIPRRN